MEELRREAGARAPSQRLLAVCGFVLFSCLCVIAAKEFAMPAAQAARTYPAHDEHPMERVAIAVDPYDSDVKALIFSVNTKDRSKLLPATTDDLLRRLSRPRRNDRQNTLPIPLPKKEVKGGVSGKTMEEIDRAMFAAKAVEPHSTARGFLFFDGSDISDPLEGATFYLMGVQDATGKEMMYFEIPMEKYLSATHAAQP